MKSIYGFFVRRPLLVNLLMVFVLIAGVMSWDFMTFQTFPKVDLGVLKVQTFRPGSGPEDVELSLTVPLEEEILKVDGLAKVSSNSMEGLSVILVRIDPDIGDKAQVIADVQKAVDRAQGRLPSDLPAKPTVEELSTTKLPVMEVHLYGKVPEQTLRRTARNLAKGLREVEGIAGVEKVGYRKREVRILLEPDRLDRLGISFGEIIGAVKSRNLRDTGGSLESFVAEKKVLTVGQFDHPKQVEDVIIRSAGPGNQVRMRDVAQVVLDFEDWKVQSRTDGITGITLLPRKKSSSDGLKTAGAVKEFVARQRPNLPAGVQLRLVNDMSRFTGDMLAVLANNAYMGFILVFVVLLVFFNFRFALWVAVGLPVAMCITFTLMPMFGLGIDVMTLTGIILVLGMLVDDAIVTGESIFRFKEQGLPAQEACIQGTAVIAPPVIMSTLTTVLAFSPVAFLGGLEGKWMWTLPVMAMLTLGGSLFECQFMLPAHLAHGSGGTKPKAWFVRIQTAYDRMIAAVIRRRYITVLAFIIASAAIVAWASVGLKFNMYPEVDIDTFHIKVELPEGTGLSRTSNKVRELEKMVRSVIPNDDLMNVVTRVGHHDTDIMGVTEGRNTAWALVTVYMLPQGERKTNSNLAMAKLRPMAEKLTGYKSLIIEPLKDTPMMGKPVEVEVIGNDDTRFDLAEILLDYLKKHPGVTSAWTSYKPGKDVVNLSLDHQALADRGLTVADAIEAVRIAFDGKIIDELTTVDEKIEYRLQYARRDKGKLETLKSLNVINKHGLPVPIRGVADFQVRPGEAAIKHYFGDRTITVYADIDRLAASTAEVNADLEKYVSENRLMQRFGRMRLWFGGELEQQKAAMGNVSIGFALCFCAIFFLLVVLFNSFTQPFLIMAVIPFGYIGVVFAFVSQGMELSMMALIGLLGLTGVLVNDSLVMIDLLNRRKKQKGGLLDNSEIAHGAGERLRPIIITTVTTVAALAPAAYELGGANPFLTPMTMVMVWGVIFGTFCTLLLLPCLYGAEQDLRKLARRIRGKS